MKKALLHGALYLAGLLGTAQLIHGFGAGFTSYSAGAFYTPDGTKVPVAEIVNFLTGGGYLRSDRAEHPRGNVVPGLRVKQGYDRPRWDYFDAQGCILVTTNSLGFRDEEFPVQKPAGEFRVLTVGDSGTFCSGVPNEDAWPQVLERLLAAGGRPVQVINGGFAAGCHTPDGYDTWMQSDGLLLQPDLVIVGFSLNDMGNGNDVPMLSYQGVTTVDCPVALIDQILTYYENRRRMATPQDFAAVVRQRPETWNGTQRGLRDLQRLLAAAGVPLVVAVMPVLSQLDLDPYPYEGLHRLAGEFFAREGMVAVDLKDRFLGKNEQDLWVHPTDQHYNHLGNRMLAEGIHEFLVRRGLDGRR